MSEWRLTSVDKSYPQGLARVQVLHGINLRVRSGEVLAVYGPHDSGKSTLLRLIAGLDTPDSGSISLDGKPLTQVPEMRDIAMVFPQMAVYPHLTVLENWVFALNPKKTGITIGEAESRAREIALQLGMSDKLSRHPHTLSGGEQQRIAIGRCLIRRPKLFLFDEPLVKLDAKLREHVREWIVRINRETGIPMVYATHDQDEALHMADRMAILEKGRILQEGHPKTLYASPVNARVASLLGFPAINLFSVSEAAKMGLSSRQGTLTAIRPEKLWVAADESGPAQLMAVQRLGRNEILWMDLQGVKIRSLYAGESGLSRGQRVRLGVDERDVHFLPE